MNVGKSAFYAWKARPAQVITAEELHLYRRAKALFKASRGSLGSRELAKNLNKEGLRRVLALKGASDTCSSMIDLQ